MAATIPYNPFLTTNAAGLFSLSSDGLVQGVAMDDPAIRNALAGGVYASDETIPAWGGIGIYEQISATGVNPLGNIIGRATSQGSSTKGLTGFAVLNQAHAGVITPQSPVPLFASGQTLNFYRFGSGARIALKIDPSLVSLEGDLITTQVSWDYTNQLIVAYDSVAALPVKILQVQAAGCKTVTYTASPQSATWNNNGACALVLI